MKKYLWYLLISVAIIIAIILCSTVLFRENERTFEKGVLYLDDNLIANDNVFISADGVLKLPIVDIFESLGMGLEYENDNLIRITYEEKEYYLNIAEKALYKEGNPSNCICFPPDARIFYKEVIDGKLVVGYNAIKTTLQIEFGILVKFNVDEENMKVTMVVVEN